MKRLFIFLLILTVALFPVFARSDGAGTGSAEAAVTYVVVPITAPSEDVVVPITTPLEDGWGAAYLQQGEDWIWAAIVIVALAVVVAITTTKVIIALRTDRFPGVELNAGGKKGGLGLKVDGIDMESEIGGSGPVDPNFPSQQILADQLEGGLRFDNPTNEPQVVQIGGGTSKICFDLQAQASVDERAEASFDFALTSPEDGTLFSKTVGVSASNGSADSKQACVSIPQTEMTIPAGSSKELTATLVNKGSGQSGPVGVIDFEEGLSRGNLVSSVSCDPDIGIIGMTCGSPVAGSVSVSPSTAAMIFDSTCTGGCSGEDDDLFKPVLENVLILTEDGDKSDPDDNRFGASFTFDFSGWGPGTVTVHSMDVLDIEEGGKIELFSGGKGGTLLASASFATGNNELKTVDIDDDGVSGVDFMRVILNGSGAIDNIVVESAPVSTSGFEGLAEGMIVDSVSCGSGISCSPVAGSISVFGFNPAFGAATNAAMIFDATCIPGGTPANCTGGDRDLFKPALGNVLIISEDLDSSDPDDNRGGGFFTFDFSGFGPGTVTVVSIDVLDVEQVGKIELFSGGDGGTLLDTVPIPATGNNQLAVVAVGVSGVDFMRVTLNGSGAIDNIQIE